MVYTVRFHPLYIGCNLLSMCFVCYRSDYIQTRNVVKLPLSEHTLVNSVYNQRGGFTGQGFKTQSAMFPVIVHQEFLETE